MKRKRNSNQSDDIQTCDLVLVDANGRSVRAHRALLIDRSDYFAKILNNDNNLQEVHLNERYLIELIHYLYNHESMQDYDSNHTTMNVLSPIVTQNQQFQDHSSHAARTSNEALSILNGDLEILMQLLALSKKYSFNQLYQKLVSEIHYKLGPTTVITVYKYARQLDLPEVRGYTLIMILSWLPQLQTTQEFLTLTEDSIHEIFAAEAIEIESESKLNALSSWWSHNKESNMTNLWVQLITCTYK